MHEFLLTGEPLPSPSFCSHLGWLFAVEADGHRVHLLANVASLHNSKNGVSHHLECSVRSIQCFSESADYSIVWLDICFLISSFSDHWINKLMNTLY